MKLEILGLNHTGSGISKINNKIIFIDKTLPQDIVEINNIEEHKNYSTGKLVKIITPSKDRVPTPCPYYNICGGCHLQGLNYSNQLKYKKEKVINILEKYSNIKVNPDIIPSSEYHYRNKISLKVKDNKLGLLSENTHNINPIDNCLLVSNKVNNLIKYLNTNINLSKVKEVIIRENNSKLMLIIKGNIPKKDIELLQSVIDSLYINDKHIYGLIKLEEILSNYKYVISPNSFFQINKEQTINLYNQVKKYLGNNNNNILDLYCGSATIGIYVSNNAKNITGIEINPSSILDAKENIKLNNITNMNVLEGNVNKLLKSNNTYDAIIVDPPRSGLDKTTKETLLKIKSPKIIYVSCNPITLARDIKDLSITYNLQDIKLFDMFPNTYHVESIVLLNKKIQLYK